MDGKFYYQQLSEEEQTVYQELLQGLLEHVEQIHVHSQKPERVNELLVYVLNDYPEIFWTSELYVCDAGIFVYERRM